MSILIGRIERKTKTLRIFFQFVLRMPIHVFSAINKWLIDVKIVRQIDNKISSFVYFGYFCSIPIYISKYNDYYFI